MPLRNKNGSGCKMLENSTSCWHCLSNMSFHVKIVVVGIMRSQNGLLFQFPLINQMDTPMYLDNIKEY